MKRVFPENKKPSRFQQEGFNFADWTGYEPTTVKRIFY